ncbi:unnamed protein product [Adineta steineri]|uniref:FAD dependent oxidoreductase domain-containing protein n=1 Tax=Adineta steineri TaxID=433720 RepID=A0A815NPT3_9BILA|nr:unnamed protein product [Adineta steineri]CAF4039705.1 unnamed protein product [Adineta steineri]CAF4066015.1 unnamed protein product [Adineta steineri]
MQFDSLKVLVVGGGTWGLSTCYHLAIRGYKHITCLDKWYYPSLDSAGNDLNKMVRSEFVDDPVMQQLSQVAMHAWKTDPLFKVHFHETGRLSLANSSVNVPEILQLYQELSTSPHRDEVRWLDNSEEIKALFPYLTGAMTGWKGVFNPEGGWIHARNAMKTVGDECVKMGVRFVLGTANKLIYHANESKVIGVECVDGIQWFADKIVLACGAWIDTLIDMQGQLVAKTWTLAHIQITDEEERRKLKGTPVVFDVEKGFFFEPDHDTGMIKVCNEYPGFTNYQHIMADGKKKWVSVPVQSSSIPTRSSREIHDLLLSLKPEWADLPMHNARMCWCTDTADRHYLITLHPEYDGTLILASGASGHGFKMLPVIGNYVADLVEGKRLQSHFQDAWRWRPEMNGSERPADDSRPGKGGDLNDMEQAGWKDKPQSSIEC